MKPHDPIVIKKIIAEIRAQLKKLDELFVEWENHRLGEWTDTFFLRGKGSVFHDFYCGVENIFKRIAPKLNGGLPEGVAWHKILLDNMRLEIVEVRPAVVSVETAKLLEEFLDFRHKFRHIYGFDLDFKKLDALDQIYPETHKQFVSDINKFIEFLNGLVKEIEQSSSDSG